MFSKSTRTRYFLFYKVKKRKGTRYESIEDIQDIVTDDSRKRKDPKEISNLRKGCKQCVDIGDDVPFHCLCAFSICSVPFRSQQIS